MTKRYIKLVNVSFILFCLNATKIKYFNSYYFNASDYNKNDSLVI